MSVLPLIRQGVLGATTLFSLIVLAISAHLMSQTQLYYDTTVIFSALALAVAVVSLVTIPIMLVVDILRHGAFTSMIVVELVWLSILWILWVASAGETVYGYDLSFPVGCIYVNTIFNGMCQETQVIEAFSFLNFIILLLYTAFLSVSAVSRGQGVWMSSVKESFGSPVGPMEHPMTQYINTPMPPRPQVYGTGTSKYSAGAIPPGATLSGPTITV